MQRNHKQKKKLCSIFKRKCQAFESVHVSFFLSLLSLATRMFVALIEIEIEIKVAVIEAIDIIADW